MEIGGATCCRLANPVRLAESLVSLDNVSGGRFLLCAALGWAPREFQALGVPINQRVGRFEEKRWTSSAGSGQDQPFEFNCRYFSYSGLRMTARPERPGGIPVWIAGSSPGGVRRAARLGDSWLGAVTRRPSPCKSSQRSTSTRQPRRAVPSRTPLLRHCMVAPTDQLAEERFTEAYNAYYR